MLTQPNVIDRFFDSLVEEIERSAPEYLEGAFTVAEIYQSLIPYRTHRDRLGVRINGDYEDALLRLLVGEGDFLLLESEPARARIQKELRSPNPNTGIYREFAAVSVRLNPRRVPVRIPGDSDLDPDEVEEQASFGDFEEEGPTSFHEEAGNASISSDRAVEEMGAGASSSAPRQVDMLGEEPARAEAGRKEPWSATPRSETRAGEQDPRSAEGSPGESCPDCDSTLPTRDSLRFCPFCGANVFVVPCGECGEVLERAWKFCVACGTSSGS